MPRVVVVVVAVVVGAVVTAWTVKGRDAGGRDGPARAAGERLAQRDDRPERRTATAGSNAAIHSDDTSMRLHRGRHGNRVKRAGGTQLLRSQEKKKTEKKTAV